MCASARRAIGGMDVAGAYSPAIVAAGTLVFVSGQVPTRGSQSVRGSIEEETLCVLENVQRVLEFAGAALGDVVKCCVYLADTADFGAMDRVYGEFFPDPKPTRTTVGAALVGGIKIEIDCIAVVAGDAAGGTPAT